MSAYGNEEKKILRPGLRKPVRQIDYNIWRWSCGKQVTKRDIKAFARKAFEDAGFTNFKASDGWYRRWFGRWRKEVTSNCVKTDPIISERLNKKHHNEPLKNKHCTLQSSSPEQLTDSNLSQSTLNKTEELTHNIQLNVSNDSLDCNKKDDCFSKLINDETTIKDCNATGGLINFKTISPNKKRGERYLPHFKNDVVSYALKYSIKDAAFSFKVNKGTVSDWIRDDKSSRRNLNNIKTEVRPDTEFVKWLQCERQEGRVINKDMLSNKLQELLQLHNKHEVKKSSQWFFNYCEKFEHAPLIRTSHVMYPIAFKIEIANLCKVFPKKVISEMFNVDRKRIRDWYHLYNKGSLKDVERDAKKYVTDENVDKQIWQWYQLQEIKPSSKQVREKGTELYTAAGFTGMRCSTGWYTRWCKRHSLPAAGHMRNERDAQLLEWLLSELDRNNNVSYARLKMKATQLWGPSLKPSTNWAIRFSKRHSQLLQQVPDIRTELPKTLESRIYKFRSDIIELLKRKNLAAEKIIAVDEVPLNFNSSNELEKPKSLIRKSGFESCHASLIISCLSEGTLLPSILILKGPLENVSLEDNRSVIVFDQEQGICDHNIFSKWFAEVSREIGSPAVIICDDYEPHVCLKENLIEEDIDVMIIPSGCNCKLQPITFKLSEQFKIEIEDQWTKWNHDNCWNNVNGSSRTPSERDIYNWVKDAHMTLADSHREEIRESFIKGGYTLPYEQDTQKH